MSTLYHRHSGGNHPHVHHHDAAGKSHHHDHEHDEITIRTVMAITLMTYTAMKRRSSPAILIGLSIGTSIVRSRASQSRLSVMLGAIHLQQSLQLSIMI